MEASDVPRMTGLWRRRFSPRRCGDAAAGASTPDAASDGLLRDEGAAGARRHLRQMPWGEEGQRRPAARLKRRRCSPAAKTAAVVSGRPASSLLVRRFANADETLEMPPSKPFPVRPRTISPHGSPPARAGRTVRPGRSRASRTGLSSRCGIVVPSPTRPAGPQPRRPFHRRRTIAPRAATRHAGRPADFDPAGVLRPDRPPAEPGAGRGVCRRPTARCLRPACRRTPCLAPLRRALGTLLARPGPLRRHGRR